MDKSSIILVTGYISLYVLGFVLLFFPPTMIAGVAILGTTAAISMVNIAAIFASLSKRSSDFKVPGATGDLTQINMEALKCGLQDEFHLTPHNMSHILKILHEEQKLIASPADSKELSVEEKNKITKTINHQMSHLKKEMKVDISELELKSVVMLFAKFDDQFKNLNIKLDAKLAEEVKNTKNEPVSTSRIHRRKKNAA